LKHPLTPTHTPPLSKARGKATPLYMLMCSSSMELIDPCRFKDTTPQQATKKKRKRSKKRPPTPKVADFACY